MKPNTETAFTLVELLVVVAIISILSAIAVPNFAEATVRSKVARVQHDMRTLATALESYHVDTNRYPARHLPPLLIGTTDGQYDIPFSLYPDFWGKVFSPYPGEEKLPIGLHVLTTPIAYLSSLPIDIFNIPTRDYLRSAERAFYSAGVDYSNRGKGGASDHIEYLDPPIADSWLFTMSFRDIVNFKGLAKGWIMFSVGPDQYIGRGVPVYEEYPYNPRWLWFTERRFYDPTNGTVSKGNIYRTQGNLTEADYLGNGPFFGV